jgi:hypothetical protein
MKAAPGHFRRCRRFRCMAALHPAPEDSSAPPGRPADGNNAPGSPDGHCAHASSNILTIIPISTGRWVAAKHFGKTNSLMKSHQNQTLHHGAGAPGQRQPPTGHFHFSGTFCGNELIYENTAKSKPQPSGRCNVKCNRGKTCGSLTGHGRACPGHPDNRALCHPDRDRRDKPGDDATSFAPATVQLRKQQKQIVKFTYRRFLTASC